MSQSEHHEQQQKVVQHLKRGACHRARARAGAGVADRDDAARVLPDRPRHPCASDAWARGARRAPPEGPGRGLQPADGGRRAGAADAGREAAKATKTTARKTTASAKRTARQASKVPGVAQAEGEIKGAVASEGDLAIARYDELTAEEIVGRLAELSQIDLAKVDAYERKNENRTTIVSRITSLRGDEPWAGYDELTAAEVQAVLSEGDDERAKQVRTYERAHKNRTGVLSATERERTNA